jgi:hypothetical protein
MARPTVRPARIREHDRSVTAAAGVSACRIRERREVFAHRGKNSCFRTSATAHAGTRIRQARHVDDASGRASVIRRAASQDRCRQPRTSGTVPHGKRSQGRTAPAEKDHAVRAPEVNIRSTMPPRTARGLCKAARHDRLRLTRSQFLRRPHPRAGRASGAPPRRRVGPTRPRRW